jgi:hypothetical protein
VTGPVPGGYAVPAPAQTVRPAPAPNRTAQGPAPTQGRPVIPRGQSPEEPPPLPLPRPPDRPRETVTLPTPEQLGLTPARSPAGEAAGLDRRLQNLNAVGFRMTKVAGDRWLVVCELPTAQPDRTHRVEAEAATQAEAVRAVLDRAEQWAAAGRK